MIITHYILCVVATILCLFVTFTHEKKPTTDQQNKTSGQTNATSGEKNKSKINKTTTYWDANSIPDPIAFPSKCGNALPSFVCDPENILSDGASKYNSQFVVASSLPMTLFYDKM